MACSLVQHQGVLKGKQFAVYPLLLFALFAFPISKAQVPISTEVTKLTADDASEGAGFGWSIAASGQTIVIGSPLDGESKAGSAYVFQFQDGQWIPVTKLVAGDAEEGDQFGAAVAIDGPTIVIGADQDDDAGFSSGAVYIFEHNGDSWEETTKLVPDDAEIADRFGFSVVVKGETLFVGAVEEDEASNNAGAVYVYSRSATGWLQQAKLTASDASQNAQFGVSLTADGNMLAVGAYKDSAVEREAGAVYIFEFTDDGWTEIAKLVADEPRFGANFGRSLSLSNDLLLIGSPNENTDDLRGGAAYVFGYSNDAWLQEARLIASDLVSDARLGESVITDGEILLLAAVGDDDAGKRSGAVYVFRHNDGAWIEQTKFVASDPNTIDNVGSSIALTSHQILVGAVGTDDVARDSGSVYVFQSPEP